MTHSSDRLRWFSVLHVKSSAQRLVPIEEIGKGLLNPLDLYETADPQSEWKVVGCKPWLQLIKKPKPLLCKGQRNRTVARHSGNWRNLRCTTGRLYLFNCIRQVRHSGRFK